MIPLRLSILGHPQRLAVFRLLMRRYPDQVPAGEISAALDIKPSTLSSYLSALMQAGLVSKTREGTWLRYQVHMATMRETLDVLYLDCCRGRPELCASFSSAAPVQPELCSERRLSVLFVCTGNSARSIFAEVILRSLGADRFDVYSAGSRPQPELNPMALQVLRNKGHDIGSLRPKSIDEFVGADAPEFDFVFTVCDQAANEECPTWDGQPISAHWGMADPAKFVGSDAEKNLAFLQTYGVLRHRLAAFAALPFDELDRISLQHAVDEISQTDGKDIK